MQKFLLFILVAFILTSCGQTTTSKNQISNKDTSTITDEEVTPDIKKLRQEYVLSYNKPIEFESFNKGKHDEQLKVWGKYYCLFDNAMLFQANIILTTQQKVLRHTTSQKTL